MKYFIKGIIKKLRFAGIFFLKEKKEISTLILALPTGYIRLVEGKKQKVIKGLNVFDLFKSEILMY